MESSRSRLKGLSGRRIRFTATFVRYGLADGVKTVLLVSISIGDVPVADHIWVRYSKAFQEVSLRQGDVVSFIAKVQPFMKGTGEDSRLDYELVRIKQVQKILDYTVI